MNSDPSPNPYPNRNNPNNLLDTIILLDTNSDRVILRKFDHSKHLSLFCDGICQNFVVSKDYECKFLHEEPSFGCFSIRVKMCVLLICSSRK